MSLTGKLSQEEYRMNAYKLHQNKNAVKKQGQLNAK